MGSTPSFPLTVVWRAHGRVNISFAHRCRVEQDGFNWPLHIQWSFQLGRSVSGSGASTSTSALFGLRKHCIITKNESEPTAASQTSLYVFFYKCVCVCVCACACVCARVHVNTCMHVRILWTDTFWVYVCMLGEVVV